jgi:hypothetical protein
MDHAKRLIVGCVLGISSQKDTDWNRWQLPFSLQYCAADRPLADRLQRSEEMVRLEAAGFVPLAIVATDANGHAGPALMIGHDTPVAIRQYLLQQAQQIFEEALAGRFES